MKNLLIFFIVLVFNLEAQVSDSKGAIIIASLEGDVTIMENDSATPLPADQVKTGGLFFEGHTVKTGPTGKVILLMSNGTVSTIKPNSSLNFKKFKQEKFDPKNKKLSELKGEPSASDTVIDLEIGDMILDVKKLDKSSNFNVESPVGTAGIRGTVPYFQVAQTPDGGFQQVTSMLKGEIAFTPKGALASTVLGPGQSLSIGIGANGILLPPSLGRVPQTLLKSIEAEIEASGDITGVSSAADGPSTTETGSDNIEEEAPSEEELNEADDSRGAASKGVDDNGSTEAVAMDKAGLIDLDNEDQLAKVDSYVEVSQKASSKLDEKIQDRRSGRRNSDKGEDDFISDLTGNFDDVVDVTIEAEALDIKDEAMFDSLLESAENAADVKEVVTVAAEIGAKDKDSLESVFKNVDQADAVKEVVAVAAEIGAKDKDNLGSVLKNADKAEDLKEVVSVASEIGAKDVTNLGSVLKNADKADSLNKVMKVAKESLGSADESGEKKLDSSSLSILSSTLQNADKADSLAEVVDVAADIGAQDAENLTAVFQNADKADDLKEVVAVASEIGAKDAANLGSVLKNADKADSLNKVMKVAKESLGTADASGEKKLDSSSLSILSSTLQNADKADSLAAVVEVAAEVGAQDATNLTSVFQNADKADDLKDVVNKAKDSGASASLGGILQKADRATDFKKVTDQLDAVALEGGSIDVFDKIEDVADVFVAVAGDEEIDQDFARNILGNTDSVTDIKNAVTLVKEKGGMTDSKALMDFAKKDVSELKAINKVAEEFGESEDALTAFVSDGLDQALQLEKAIESGDIDPDQLANDIDGGGSFTEVVSASALTKLQTDYSENSDFLEIISINSERAQDISFALSFVEPGSQQEAALFGNIDKIDAIMNLSNRFEEDPAKLSIVYDNLDVAIALDELVFKLKIYPKRLELALENADLAPAILETYRDYESIGEQGLISEMFSSSDSLRDFISNDGLTKLIRDYPEFAQPIEKHAEIAGEIMGLIGLAGDEFAEDILHNLELFDKLSVLVHRSGGDARSLEALFNNISLIDGFKDLSDRYKNENIAGGQVALFASLDLFREDPGYFLLAEDDPKFFVRLTQGISNLDELPSTLAFELQELGLSRDELFEVLKDMVDGPNSDDPNSTPPSDELTEEDMKNYDLLSLSGSHVIEGSINPDLIISYETASASELFEEFFFVFDDLSALDHGAGDYLHEYQEEDEGLNPDSIDSEKYYPDYNQDEFTGVLGGRELTIGSGEYELSDLPYESLIFAATDSLSISGDLILNGSEEMWEVLFVSAGSLSISSGSSIEFSGRSLGIGAFDSINILNVDLKAQGEISVRSLEDLVISNSDFTTTNGFGSDLIHLLAYQQLEIDNLRFSEQVRQITMEAMTINLMNVNFPKDSEVTLNSAYGPLEGKYPNFGSVVYGRVNFVQDVRYNSNLLNSKSTFDQFGSSIHIGSTGK